MKNRSKAIISTHELSPKERGELEQKNAYGAKVETPEESVLFNRDAEDVRRALEALPTPFREVMVLREINQLNYRDIAEITDVPIGTVMSRLSRGRQLLFALLANRE